MILEVQRELEGMNVPQLRAEAIRFLTEFWANSDYRRVTASMSLLATTLLQLRETGVKGYAKKLRSRNPDVLDLYKGAIKQWELVARLSQLTR